jgi:large subunit ribosomal protein L6
MSRIGKKIRVLPNGVTAEVKGSLVVVKGTLGELTLDLPMGVEVSVNDNEITVAVKNEEDQRERALWGTMSSLIENMLVGVSAGFKKELEVNGVGFKVALKGKDLDMRLGFSHPVEVKAPSGITFAVAKNVITVSGVDKQLVGETAANIRKLKKPEPYKGKGIKYTDEVIRRKVGKAAAKAAA